MILSHYKTKMPLVLPKAFLFYGRCKYNYGLVGAGAPGAEPPGGGPG